jgi:hypothetical protein
MKLNRINPHPKSVTINTGPSTGPTIFETLEKNYKDLQIKNEILTKINLDNGKIIYELNSKNFKLEKSGASNEINEKNKKFFHDTVELLNYKQKKKNKNFEDYITYQNEISNKLARTLFTIRAIISTVDTSVLVPKGTYYLCVFISWIYIQYL